MRWLIQREPSGKWCALPPVARVSEDAVANVHQGAQALPAETVLPSKAVESARSLVYEVAHQLQARSTGLVVELGVDLVFDTDFRPWLLEINSRPSGRFQALSNANPDRYNSLAEEAVLRPIRCLAALS